MKISVAIATYNGANYIIEQLDSIRKQSRIIDEVVVSDDYSQDGTFDIVKDYISKYMLNHWRVIYNTVGKGLRDNFYSALNMVTGDLIFLADQDNQWFYNKISILENIYESNPQIMCLNNSFRYIDENGKEIDCPVIDGTSNNGLILHQIKAESIEQIKLELVINKNIGPGLAMSMRKKVVDNYLQYSQKIELHDFELNCIAAEMNGLYFYNKELDYYRIFDGQAVSVGIMKKRLIWEVLKEKIILGKCISERIQFIEQLIEMNYDQSNTDYLKKLYALYLIKEKVAINHKIFYWLVEYKMYKKLKKEYGYMDMKYCYIDLISGFIPSIK